MNEIEQKLKDLRDSHLALAGKIKCLQELSNLYYDIRHWLGDEIMNLEEISKIEIDLYVERLNSPLSYEETTKILSVVQIEHNRLRDIARERKYKSL